MTRLLAAFAILLTTSTALADGFSAQFGGTVTEVPIDYDGDGFNGRGGYLDIAQPSVMRSITVSVLDAKLGEPTAECPFGTIVPSGIIYLGGWGTGWALAELDPSVTECLTVDPAGAVVVEAIVSDADGSLAWLGGKTLSFDIVDLVLFAHSGPLPYPRVVLTHGTMTVL